MTHPSVEDVALHLEGVLDPADDLRVRTHLEQCADCADTAQGLLGVSEQLHAAAVFSESSESGPAIPADVAARVESAIAREVAGRDAGVAAGADEVAAEGPVPSGTVPSETVPSETVPSETVPSETVPSGPIGDLAERRRRRRRVLSGGLLAAAAATVVAVGLGQLTQSGGPGQAASGSAGSVTAQQDSGVAGAQPQVRGGPERALSDDQGRAGLSSDSGGKQPGPSAPLVAAFPGRLRDAGLIEGVAAAHSPDQPQHDLPGCVRAALGDNLGPVASYTVRLPGSKGTPAVVVLRPNRAPTEGVLVACTAQPHVLARRGLHP